jgi:hypothetical protein
MNKVVNKTSVILASLTLASVSVHADPKTDVLDILSQQYSMDVSFPYYPAGSPPASYHVSIQSSTPINDLADRLGNYPTGPNGLFSGSDPHQILGTTEPGYSRRQLQTYIDGQATSSFIHLDMGAGTAPGGSIRGDVIFQPTQSFVAQIEVTGTGSSYGLRNWTVQLLDLTTSSLVMSDRGHLVPNSGIGYDQYGNPISIPTNNNDDFFYVHLLPSHTYQLSDISDPDRSDWVNTQVSLRRIPEVTNTLFLAAIGFICLAAGRRKL